MSVYSFFYLFFFHWKNLTFILWSDFLESDEDERNLLEEEKDLPIEEVLQRIYGDKGPPQDDDGVKFTSRLAQEIYNGLNEDEDDEEYNDEEWKRFLYIKIIYLCKYILINSI